MTTRIRDCRFLPLGDDWDPDGAQKGGGGMNGFHDVIVALQVDSLYGNFGDA